MGVALAPLEGEVETPAEARLHVLADAIRAEHAAMLEAAQQAIGHAVAIGEALIEAKGLVPPGDWGRWIERNVPYGKRRAWCGNYMRLAALKDSLDPELGITANLQLVRGLERRHGGTPRVPEETKAEVRRLHALGTFTNVEIARMAGTTKHSVRNWVDPDHERKRWDASNEARRRKREARESEAPAPPDSDEVRANRYGDPGRAAVGLAVQRLARAQGAGPTVEALLDLSAICSAWSALIGPRGAASDSRPRMPTDCHEER